MSCESASGLISLLSCSIGATEAAFKLILTIFLGYPLALIYRKYVNGKEANLQHLYFIGTGFGLGVWNYGYDMCHCMLATLVTFVLLNRIGGTQLSVILSFLFNMGYLLTGYLLYSTNDYDINWTMPQCILTLRLIGITFDLYDGQQPPETLSEANKLAVLNRPPTILEIYGHCLFPSAFLVGPQFPMKRYLDYVSGQFNIETSMAPAIQRLALGCLYLSVFQMLGFFVSDDYLLTDDFAQLGFLKRMLLMGMWGRFTLYKYISCWLLTEGACIMFGMSYNGSDDDSQPKWNGVENIKLGVFENTTEFGHYIQSFNVNTNHWLAQYVYKRLKFLNNRLISQFAALMFLAVWHGFHSGYYICFFFEFIVIYMERDIKSIVNKSEALTAFFTSPHVSIVLQILLRIYTFVFMGWCLMPFALLQFPKYWHAFANVNYIGILVFVLWPLVYAPLIRLALGKQSKKISEPIKTD